MIIKLVFMIRLIIRRRGSSDDSDRCRRRGIEFRHGNPESMTPIIFVVLSAGVEIIKEGLIADPSEVDKMIADGGSFQDIIPRRAAVKINEKV